MFGLNTGKPSNPSKKVVTLFKFVPSVLIEYKSLPISTLDITFPMRKKIAIRRINNFRKVFRENMVKNKNLN
tara:strand:+ start:167 stop:382 length:216 start_codon:yes stop_codon:yes gene_type:complete